MSKKYKNQSDNHLIKNTFLRDLDPSTLERKLREESYLGILTNDDTLFNPLNNIPMVAHDHFNEYLAYLMTRPEYFSFIVKTMFNMESFPLQMLLLKELYEHRFPILIGARGLSKTYTLGMYLLIKMITTPGVKCVITGAGFRQAKLVFDVMETIWGRAPMLRNCFRGDKNGPKHGTDAWYFRLGDSTCHALPVGHDGSKVRGYRANCLIADEFACTRKSLIATDLGLLKIEDIVNNKIKCNVYNHKNELEPIVGYVKTPLTDVYRLTTKYGYEIDFSDKHQFMLEDGSWKLGKDLTDQDYIIFDHNYKFNDTKFQEYQGISQNKIAYLCGLLISEGSLTDKYSITITNTDKDLIDRLVEDFSILNPKVYTRDAYVDDRGWSCKKRYDFKIHSIDFRKYLESLGISYDTCNDKKLPSFVLKYDRDIVLNFLNGMFIGDGSAFNFTEKRDGKTRFGIAYYSVSKELIDDLHVLLKYMGYISYKSKRSSELSNNDQWFVRLNGKHAERFAIEIKYPLAEEMIKNVSDYSDRLYNHTGTVTIRESKKGLRYKAQTYNNGKTVFLGTYSNIEDANKSIAEFQKNKILCVKVKKVEKLNEQDYLYDISLPDTHSYYANGLVNHNSLPKTIFEEVMSGFLSVSSDNILQMKQNAFDFSSSALGVGSYWESKDSGIIQNQLILSGTAYYKHNHFYEYFKKWTDIIASEGNPEILKSILPDEESRKDLNHEDYTVIRIPVEKIQSGHMDMAQVSRIKASVNKDTYLREFSACFSDDSDGFFKRSLINSCTISEENKITKGGEEIRFNPAIYGRKDKKHIFGIDPAYQGDNFAIVILEINDTHRRIVHCWTTQASDHKQRLKDGIITENNYYQYCVRKVRDLMKRFPCAYIAMDKGGGGDAVKEAFADTLRLSPGEEAILPIIEPTEDPKDTDFLPGEHILHIIKFTSDWITQANHALKKDMETRDIIFPFHDSVSYIEAEFYSPVFVQAENATSFLYDTLEDCMSEIEDLKNELSIITISETATGKEHFDTPDKKTSGMQKGRMRKDRYSALLMANWVARNSNNLIVRPLNTLENAMEAYFGSSKNKVGFLGNGPIAQKLNELYSDDL